MKLKSTTLLCFIVTTVVVISSCFTKNSRDKLPDKVSYNFQIRPIFSDKCFKCHGPDANKRQAGFWLDIPEKTNKKLKKNPRAHAIVPGHPHLSEMFLRINSTDTAIQKPPPQRHLSPLI